jgi:hypothetical protein
MATRHNTTSPATPSSDASTETTPHANVDLTSPAPSTSPSMPNDRDEKVGMTGGIASKRVQQGSKDVKRGVQDTSRAPEADKAYQKQK